MEGVGEGCSADVARGVLEGEEVGVVLPRIVLLEGERFEGEDGRSVDVDGDSGRRKGEARGVPVPRGEGFFGEVLEDCCGGDCKW